MNESLLRDAETDAVLTRLRADVDDLIGLDLGRLGRDELVGLVRDLEVQVRRLPAVDARQVAELDRRAVAGELGCRDTKTLLCTLLNIGGDTARSRVRDAELLAGRVTLAGMPVPPLYPRVAEAVERGVISTVQARTITSTIEHLPMRIRDQHGEAAEQFLVEQAEVVPPTQLRVIARRLVDTLDPDGTLTEQSDHVRRRELVLTQHADGSGEIAGHLTPPVFQRVRAVLDPLAKPNPASDGERDRRTAPQRLHDGLDAAMLRLLRSGDLPDSGGTPATVLVTMTAEQFTNRTGLARTDTGSLIPVKDLMDRDADVAIVPIALEDTGRVAAIGHQQRLATPSQRLALAVRDKGCSAPGCTVAAAWCDTNHVTGWRLNRRTTLDDLCLACGYHHGLLDHGWTCTMINHRPHWTAPPWLDPAQVPRANTAHYIPEPTVPRPPESEPD